MCYGESDDISSIIAAWNRRAALSQQPGAVEGLPDKGPWQHYVTGDGKDCVASNDFNHDALLVVTGDFAEGERAAYCKALARVLTKATGLASQGREAVVVDDAMVERAATATFFGRRVREVLSEVCAFPDDLIEAALRAALSQQPAAVECPHRTRCDCLASCKYGYASDGATQHQEPTT